MNSTRYHQKRRKKSQSKKREREIWRGLLPLPPPLLALRRIGADNFRKKEEEEEEEEKKREINRNRKVNSAFSQFGKARTNKQNGTKVVHCIMLHVFFFYI